ncbi:LuxR C-terminal-related transcriptional regulator [Lentzea sp. NPDC051838]|uniref:LuxR C-terminal-related transcriptional regulator n=1 Tax=Lentzea sp. NPDC051838 TaxID=3154849 RepID=UPI00342C1563
MSTAATTSPEHCDERTLRAVGLTRRGTDRATAIALAREVLRSGAADSDVQHCLLVLTYAGTPAGKPDLTAPKQACELVEQGRCDEALDVLLACAESPESLFARGRLNQAAGQHDRAYADFLAVGRAAEAVGMANPAVMPWCSAAAISAHETGRAVVARSLAEAELVAARRWGDARTVGRAVHAVGLTGDPDRAVTRFTTAVRLLGDAGTPAELLSARHHLAQALATQGRHAEAIEVCTESLALAKTNPLWTRQAEELGARLERLSRLTPQESRAAALACGMSNREVAAELGVTTRTVELHLTQVYRKLDVTGRRELNRVILRLGVTPP